MKGKSKIPEEKPRDVIASRGAQEAERSRNRDSVQHPQDKDTLCCDAVKQILSTVPTAMAAEEGQMPSIVLSPSVAQTELGVVVQSVPDTPCFEEDAWESWATLPELRSLLYDW